jgi:hypothetical protein
VKGLGVTWPSAKIKFAPSAPTALQTVLPTELARIVAVAHSGVTQCQQADAIGLKYNGFQLVSCAEREDYKRIAGSSDYKFCWATASNPYFFIFLFSVSCFVGALLG